MDKFVADMTKQMETSLKIDPLHVVVVCITGYQFDSSLTAEQRNELIAEMTTQMKAQLKDEVAREVTQDLDLDIQAERCLKALGGSTSGMQNLRNEFAIALSKYGVPGSNIIWTKWTTKKKEWYKDQPEYDSIVNRINSIDPSYLAIFGHSYGGCTACRISRVTSRIPDFIGLVDPIFIPAEIDWYGRVHTSAQSNRDDNYPRGKMIINWYQSHHWPKGFHDVLDIDKKKVTNIAIEGVTHTTIDDYPPLHRAAINTVVNAIKS